MNIENGFFFWMILMLGLWAWIKIYQIYSKKYNLDAEAACFVTEDFLNTPGYGRYDDPDNIDVYDAVRLLETLKVTYGVYPNSVTSRRINKSIIMKFPKLAQHLAA